MRSPTLTLFCGLPGAGKTTLAKRLEAEGRGVRLCTDEWQASLGFGHADGGFHDRLQRQLYALALDLLRIGTDVILEDGLWTRAERTPKLRDARDAAARVELHVFDITFDVLWSRLQQRNADTSAAAYPMTYDDLRRAFAIFEPPVPTELADVSHHLHRHPMAGPGA